MSKKKQQLILPGIVVVTGLTVVVVVTKIKNKLNISSVTLDNISTVTKQQFSCKDSFAIKKENEGQNFQINKTTAR